MDSVLGRLQLGAFEPGALAETVVTTGTCKGLGGPVRQATYVGGLVDSFSAVPGSIRSGFFMLGAVPAIDLRIAPGSYSAEGNANPVRQARIPLLTGSCSGEGNPTRQGTFNLGPVICKGLGHPARSAVEVAYYAEMTAGGLADPSRFVQGLVPGAAIGFGNPVRTLSPIGTQQVSCVVGNNPPEALIQNYVY